MPDATSRRMPMPHSFLLELAENRRASSAVALAIFIALTAAWFWPIVVHPESKILRGPADGTVISLATETHAASGADLLVAPPTVQPLADYSIVLANA